MKIATAGLVVSTAFAGSASALWVTQDSPCSRSCGNVLSSTTGADMVCNEGDYSSTSAGIVYQTCISCEMASSYSRNGQTDLQWLLYNLRYTISYCLFGDPDNKNVISSPCITSTACGPLKDAFEWNNLTTSGGAFDFCQKWNEIQVGKCGSCIEASDYHFMNNYLTMLDAACQQRPAIGSTISVEGIPFSTVRMNITTPSPVNPYKVPVDNSPVSLGAKVGIAIGGVVLILALAGCGIVCNGRRRRRNFLRRLEAHHRDQGWPTPNPAGTETFETPMSQKPLRGHGWEDSPVSAHTDQSERAYPRYFSPYSSQYNSPVSAVEGTSMQWPANAWPTSAQEKLAQEARDREYAQALSPQEMEIGIALGGDDPSIKSKKSNQSMGQQQEHGWDVKGKDRDESYELLEVDSNGSIRPPMPAQAPVLLHPGYGRKYSPPQTAHGLTEDDARRGNAL